jgi:immune inhibitor A
MANYPNVAIQRIFVSHHSQNCWAALAGVGWRKVGTLSVDGTADVHAALVAARAQGISANVTTDAADSQIEIVYV